MKFVLLLFVRRSRFDRVTGFSRDGVFLLGYSHFFLCFRVFLIPGCSSLCFASRGCAVWLSLLVGFCASSFLGFAGGPIALLLICLVIWSCVVFALLLVVAWSLISVRGGGGGVGAR